MSIFKTAYDTTVGSGFVVTKLKDALDYYYINGLQFDNFGLNHQFTYSFNNNDIMVRGIIGGTSDQEGIPVFSHPLLIESNTQKSLYCDFRTVLANRLNQANEKPIIKNKTEFDLIKARFALNLIWLAAPPTLLRDVSTVHGSMYAAWVSEGIANKFNLDPKERFYLAIIAAAFYYTLFLDKDKLDEEDKEKMQAFAIKYTKAPYNMISEVVEQITELNNITDFCNTTKAILQNPRIESLNAGLMVNILGGSWFGTNARENMAVALEHPPTWIALCFCALRDRTYRNSGISRIGERYEKHKGGDLFIKGIVSLINNYSDKEQQMD